MIRGQKAGRGNSSNRDGRLKLSKENDRLFYRPAVAPVHDSAGVETIGTELTCADLMNSAGRILNTIHPEPEPRNAAATDVFGKTSQVS